MVHSKLMNHLVRSLATMRGAGLRDEDVTKSFAKMVRHKLKAGETDSIPHFLMEYEDLISVPDNHEPIQEIKKCNCFARKSIPEDKCTRIYNNFS